MKNLVLFVAVLLFTATAFSQTARVQVIHNSADAAASEVDVYLNSDIAIDDFEFRTATTFLDLPAGAPIDLSVAPGNSTGVGDALLTVTVTLMPDETYIVVADGIVSGSGYNPAPPLSLQVYAMAREAASNPSNVDILVHHGATDAPTVDVVETGVGAGTIVDDISYSEFDGYLELPTADYTVEIRLADGSQPGVAAYEAPLSTLMLDGAALTVLASGFLDPSQNSNGPGFGLFVASPLGGALLALPTAALGVDEFGSNALRVFPNPTSDILNLSVQGFDLSNTTLQITDMLGRIVAESINVSDNASMDVSGLNAGVYQVTILREAAVVYTKRFVKE
ncbi:DUF4397 domain-containing protein [Altibacter sp.]|uniref:T9SS type A sorting domain-containing protein n=1 Tax=Altibacter sp. TaxID=2024823 RepID=UPI0025903174|nr:DUF4397 domain-containing protein [Altibacter sp.]MCW9038210.1 DUF4397 domain-containing protein [Altibacter sp.]